LLTNRELYIPGLQTEKLGTNIAGVYEGGGFSGLRMLPEADYPALGAGVYGLTNRRQDAAGSPYRGRTPS